MTTPADLIRQSLKAVGVLGVGQTPLAEDINDGFTAMKQMLYQWQKRRWLVPALIDYYAIGNNAVSNAIGPNQYFNISRPDKIEAAYVRLNSTATENGYPDFSADFNNDFSVSGQPITTTAQTVDFPLMQITSYQDYSRIALKGLNSFPNSFFYDGAYPYGNLYVWPIPTPSYEIHIIVKVLLGDYVNLQTEFTLPDEYEEAIWSNLAIRLCANYQVSASKELLAIAKAARNTIRISNIQIPSLQMPYPLRNNVNYNIWSDTVNQ